MNKAISRRDFIKASGALGAASALGLSEVVRAEPPPETNHLRIMYTPAMCVAPQYIAEQFLRIEGFSEVEYVQSINTSDTVAALADNRLDIGVKTTPYLISELDSAPPVVALAGMHLGCYELFANEHVRAIRDLKHRSIAISRFGSSEHVFISSMLAYVGMDPAHDVEWIHTGTTTEGMELFANGGADAFLAFPPEPQELRQRHVKRVIVNTALDQPWANYYCCMVAGSKQFVQQHPIATRRALRAMLKAADLCSTEPETAARFLVEKGYEPRIEIAREMLSEVRYDAWRTYNPEDSIRFYALRLYDVGMIRTDPNTLISQNTDWRHLDKLKKELKA